MLTHSVGGSMCRSQDKSDSIGIMSRRKTLDLSDSLAANLLPSDRMEWFEVRQHWAEKSHCAPANQRICSAFKELCGQL